MNTAPNAVRAVGNVPLHALCAAAACWAAAGLAVVIPVVRGVIKKKSGKTQDADCGTEGMSLGMCLGFLTGAICRDCIGTGISIGMIIGLAVGICIPKKREEREK